MVKIPGKIEAWQMVEPGKLARASLDVPELKADEVLVEIAGCGVCHTDIGYFYEGVKTVSQPPLTLGHEISGRVVAGEEEWIGEEVIIPSTMPCNDCPICAAGRGNRCLNQKMPGNSMGAWGGFASHIPVPAHDLCPVTERGEIPLENLAVIADAITSPYQAAMKAELKPGDRVIVVGATGGTGSFMSQVCAALGAEVIVGLGRNQEKLERAKNYGVSFTINIRDKSPRDVRGEFRELCRANNLPDNYGWKIFECTGTLEGQQTGLELLSFIGKLVLFGYGTQVNQYMLSRVMAFDAEIIGTWSCLPQYYLDVLNLVVSDKIKVQPLTEIHPMSEIEKWFELVHEGKHERRPILTPDF
jgi:6-hydroxycyclohex-1-ene-1-carbonyl-CoA dehydrogenase